MSSGDESSILMFENSFKKCSNSFSNEYFCFPYFESSTNKFKYPNLLFVSKLPTITLRVFNCYDLSINIKKTFKMKVLMHQGSIQSFGIWSKTCFNGTNRHFYPLFYPTLNCHVYRITRKSI